MTVTASRRRRKTAQKIDRRTFVQREVEEVDLVARDVTDPVPDKGQAGGESSPQYGVDHARA